MAFHSLPLCIKTASVNVILKMMPQHYSDCKELVLFGITAKNGLRRACSPTFLGHKWRTGQWPRRKSPQFCRLWNCKLNPFGIRPAIPCCLSELYLCTLAPHLVAGDPDLDAECDQDYVAVGGGMCSASKRRHPLLTRSL